MAEVVPRRIYYRVHVALLVLLLLTRGLSYLALSHALSITAALSIAISKALLIVLFFMHVRYSRWLIWVFVGAGIAWMGHILILTMSDYLTRSVITANEFHR